MSFICNHFFRDPPTGTEYKKEMARTYRSRPAGTKLTEEFLAVAINWYSRAMDDLSVVTA
jgi:hypothetical protein